jgi:Fic family protein
LETWLHLCPGRKENEKVYEGPRAEDVPKLISELVSCLNGPVDSDPLFVKGAMAHLNLVMIHPFSDGNGRMARCLHTLVLALRGIVDPTFCSVEEYLCSNTDEYHRILADVGQVSWHPENDTRIWIRFNLTAHYRQALTALRRTRTISRLWDALERDIKKSGLNERSIYALADAAVDMRVRAANYRHMAELSDVVASRDLKAMVRSGLLVPQGERRGRTYMASDAIRQIAVQIRQQEPGGIKDPFAPDVSAKA